MWIYNMKTTIKTLFAISLLLTAAACNKGQVGMAGDDGIDDSTREPVRFASSVSGVCSSTKAAGTLDAWTGGETLYVIALERDSQGGYVFGEDGGMFIGNAPALSPASGADGLVKEGEIKLYNPAGGPEEPFYYGEAYYDFFAYYVDDAAAETDETGAPIIEVDTDNNVVLLDVHIDGSQDILMARTDKVADIAAAQTYNSFLGKSVTINPDKVYSAYAARRNVMPELHFEHQLSRFTFEIKSGSQIVADEVYIVGLSLESDSDATFVVAGDIPSYYDGSGNQIFVNLWESWNPADLPLMYKPSPELPLGLLDNSETYRIKCPAYDDNESIEINGSIMVMPDADKYKLKLRLYQAGYTVEDGVDRPLTIDFKDINGGTGKQYAEAGYSYKVTIYVYGLEKVEVKVSLADWQEGGGFTIDPDAD